MVGWRQVCVVLALVMLMRTTNQWDLAFIMTETPSDRRPLLELPPHVTLDYHPIEPAIALDDQEIARVVGLLGNELVQ
jgi:hypothetical protein